MSHALTYNLTFPNATMSAYPYDQLPTHGHIRLFKLEPGKFGDPLCGALTPALLSDGPKYDALSYTWGDPTMKFRLQLEGGYTLGITSNLQEALQHLRSKSEPGTLWIDAVCINQADISERGAQVRIMFDIFRSARTVRVWLGLRDKSSDMFFDLIEEVDPDEAVALANDFASLRKSTDVKKGLRTWNFSPWPKHIATLRDEKQWQVAKQFFLRPWFRRVWVQQEIAAGAPCSVHCGSRIVLWEGLFGFVWAILKLRGRGELLIGLSSSSKDDGNNRSEVGKSLISLQSMSLRRQLKNWDRRASLPESVLFTLEGARYCHATDPRDRVFALEHISVGDNDYQSVPILAPDYSLTTEAVYTLLVSVFAEKSSVEFLICSGKPYQKLEKLPSWVPDWSCPRSGTYVANSNDTDSLCAGLTRGSCRIAKIGDTSALIASGVVFDEITQVSGCTSHHSTKSQSLSEQTELRERLESDCAEAALHYETYPTGERPIEAYWKTLVRVSDYTDSLGPPKDLDDLKKRQDERHAILTSSEIPVNIKEEDHQEYIDMMQTGDAFVSNQVCFTARGYFGLVPDTVKPGDCVCIILGSTKPIVLRKLENGFFESHGPCFVYGINTGEALRLPDISEWLRNSASLAQQTPIFGTLPDGWIETFSNQSLRYFVSKEKGKWLQDPRYRLHSSAVEVCPEGWEVIAHEDNDKDYIHPSFVDMSSRGSLPDPWVKYRSDYGAYYINTEKGQATFDDPRFLEELEAMPLPDGWEIIFTKPRIKYFAKSGTDYVSFRDPRAKSSEAHPLPEGIVCEYLWPLCTTAWVDKKTRQPLIEDPRFPNPLTGPVPPGYTATRQTNGDTKNTIVFTEESTGKRTTEDPCLLPNADFPGFVII